MSSSDIVVVGSCNIDFTLYTNKLPKRGETVFGTKFINSYGGKGANQCIAATKLGASTALVARLGNDHFGNEYLNLLKKLNVNTSHVTLTDGVSSGVAQITVSEDEGDNYILIVEGANGVICGADVEKALDVIKNAKVGLFQCEIPIKTTIAAMRVFKEKSNAILMFNPSPVPKQLDQIIFQLVDIIIANETEAESISKKEVKSVEDAVHVSRTLVKMGFKIAIITLGQQGAVYFTTQEVEPVHIPVKPVSNPVDPTGAGDLFLGALAYAFVYKSKLELREKIQFACNVARECVNKHGAQDSFPFSKDIPHLLS